jgi:hypothetical protein
VSIHDAETTRLQYRLLNAEAERDRYREALERIAAPSDEAVWDRTLVYERIARDALDAIQSSSTEGSAE